MNILILGLGQYPKGSGVAAAIFFAKRGDEVIATDLKSAKELAGNVKQLKKYSNVRFHLGKHDLKDVRWADLIVRNQRVRVDSPEIQEAKRLGKPITSDIVLFLEACPALVVGVTGTRGKSTTSAMIAEIMKEAERGARSAERKKRNKRRVWLGGNILVSPLTFLHRVKKNDIVVLELSSWQLEITGERGISPPVAVWTNLMRDHLNTYAGMEEYAEAKAQIFLHQKKDGVVFLPKEKIFDQWARMAPGAVERGACPEASSGCRLNHRQNVERQKMKLIGEHNQQNAAMAAAVAKYLGVNARTIARALKNFKGLPNRLEIVAKKKGATFINDTTSTTPDATVAALRAYHVSRITHQQTPTMHLIFGGNDKDLIFDDVAKEIKRAKARVYLLPGTAHQKIIAAFAKANVSYEDVVDLKTAMKFIKQNMKRGDIVLLSPGCTSFGQFKNEFDRGDKFKDFVEHL